MRSLPGFAMALSFLSELDESKDAIVLRGSTGAEVTAIAVTASLSHVQIGDDKGHILRATLRAGKRTVRFSVWGPHRDAEGAGLYCTVQCKGDTGG